MSDPWALARYQAIAAYVALVPPRGKRRTLLDQLAGRPWPAPGGEPFTASAETLRVWVRRYPAGGLDGLRDSPASSRGVRALTQEEIEIFCALKREVPARSLDRLIEIAEALELVEPGKARRSTVHRALRAEDLSARRPVAASNEDLDRFEAGFPNEIWQSDMLEGPSLPDPDQRGSSRRDLPAVVKLLDVKDDKPMPASSHPAFNPDDSDRWREIEAAWAAIGPMYWGPREPLIEATRVLRLFLDEVAGA